MFGMVRVAADEIMRCLHSRNWSSWIRAKSGGMGLVASQKVTSGY